MLPVPVAKHYVMTREAFDSPLTATVLAIFPSRAGYLDQSGNPCMPPPRSPNPLSSVTRGLTNQISLTIRRNQLLVESCVPERKVHGHTHVHQRLPLLSCDTNGDCTLAHRQITGNLLPVAAAMAAGGPYTYCGCQRHRLTQQNLSQDPPTISVNLTEGVLL